MACCAGLLRIRSRPCSSHVAGDPHRGVAHAAKPSVPGQCIPIGMSCTLCHTCQCALTAVSHAAQARYNKEGSEKAIACCDRRTPDMVSMPSATVWHLPSRPVRSRLRARAPGGSSHSR